MTTAGWIFFSTANIAILAMLIFCIYRVLTTPGKKIPSMLDVETNIIENGE